MILHFIEKEKKELFVDVAFHCTNSKLNLQFETLLNLSATVHCIVWLVVILELVKFLYYCLYYLCVGLMDWLCL